MTKGQAERLFPLLEELLAEAGLSWSELGAIGVGVGPGNFTGIRISVAAARGLALSLGIPAVGVSATEAAACDAPRPCRAVVPLRAEEVVWQDFGLTGGDPAARACAAGGQIESGAPALIVAGSDRSTRAEDAPLARPFPSDMNVAGPGGKVPNPRPPVRHVEGAGDASGQGSGDKAEFPPDLSTNPESVVSGAEASELASLRRHDGSPDGASSNESAEAGEQVSMPPPMGSAATGLPGASPVPSDRALSAPVLSRADPLPPGPPVCSPLYPVAVAIARMALARVAAAERIARPAPLYLRPADAAPPRDPPPVILR